MGTPTANRLLSWRRNSDAKEKRCKESRGKRVEVSKGESNPDKAARHLHSHTLKRKLTAAFPPKFRKHTSNIPSYKRHAEWLGTL